MDTTQAHEQAEVTKIYNYAATLLVKEKRSPADVIETLKQQGLNDESAGIVVGNLQGQIRSAKGARAKKDMLYGALWCIGGIIATAANIGFIFWGAIVFGGIQFFRGLSNSAA